MLSEMNTPQMAVTRSLRNCGATSTSTDKVGSWGQQTGGNKVECFDDANDSVTNRIRYLVRSLSQ